MKTIVIFIAAVLLSGVTYAQDFSKYSNMSGVTSVVINKNMFKLMNQIEFDSEDPEVQEYIEMINNLQDIKIFTTENPEIAKKLNADAEEYLSKNKLEELMRIQEDGQRVLFMYQPGNSDNEIKQLVMHVNSTDGSDESVLIIVDGLIDLKQVSKLANKLNMPGANELSKKQ
jgi:hypothetical protein